MKTPVIDLKDFLNLLKTNKERITKDFSGVMTPNQIKQVTTEAVVGNTSERVTAFKEILDNIRTEGYYNGQLSIIDHLILVTEKQLKTFEESQNVPTTN